MFLLFSDINELNLPKTCQVDFPDPDDLLNFKVIISPDEVCILCMSVSVTVYSRFVFNKSFPDILLSHIYIVCLLQTDSIDVHYSKSMCLRRSMTLVL